MILIPDVPTTGNHLRMTRLVRRVPVSAVARQAGVSRQRIHQVEAADRPSRTWRERYLAALARAELER
jgi:hypothetical protein